MENRLKHFLSSINTTYSKPEKKFIADIVTGIIKSKSPIIADAARAVTSCILKFLAVYKRLIRQLGTVDLEFAFSQAQNEAVKLCPSEDVVIAVDGGDLIKEHARKLEGLGRVPDGSDQHRVKNGYYLNSAIVSSLKERTPVPLFLDIYSTLSEEFISQNEMTNRILVDCSMRLNGKGTFVLDRGYDRTVIYRKLMELPNSFIVRLKKRALYEKINNKKIMIGERTLKHGDLKYTCKELNTRKSNKRKKKERNIRFDYTEVVFSSTFAGCKSRNIFLVTVWDKERPKPIELITTMPIKSPKDAVLAIKMYFSRWAVEEYYRFIKLELNLEDMRLRSLGKLRNMIRAIFIASVFIASIAVTPNLQKKMMRTNLTARRRKLKICFNWCYLALQFVRISLNHSAFPMPP